MDLKKIDFGKVLVGVAFLTFFIFGVVTLYLSAQLGEAVYAQIDAQQALIELVMTR